MAWSSGLLSPHRTLVQKISKAHILSLFTLMKAFKTFTLVWHQIAQAYAGSAGK
jgi:hypothetical protein